MDTRAHRFGRHCTGRRHYLTGTTEYVGRAYIYIPGEVPHRVTSLFISGLGETTAVYRITERHRV